MPLFSWARRRPYVAPVVFLLLAGTVPLAAALVAQYGFNLLPCDLCIWQRWPYVALLVFGALAIPAMRIRHRGILRYLLILALLACLVGAGIGGYHVGVEQGWIAGPSGCSSEASPGITLEELRDQIMNAPLARCDQPSAVFFGVSMAAWNVLLSLALALISLWLIRNLKPRKKI